MGVFEQGMSRLQMSCFRHETSGCGSRRCGIVSGELPDVGKWRVKVLGWLDCCRANGTVASLGWGVGENKRMTVVGVCGRYGGLNTFCN